jgi:hypothetical protein
MDKSNVWENLHDTKMHFEPCAYAPPIAIFIKNIKKHFEW